MVKYVKEREREEWRRQVRGAFFVVYLISSGIDDDERYYEDTNEQKKPNRIWTTTKHKKINNNYNNYYNYNRMTMLSVFFSLFFIYTSISQWITTRMNEYRIK